MTTNNPYLSPLRYPGSKRRLAEFIKQALVINHLSPQLYVEPFVGGASVALELLKNDLVDRVILIDLDPWVASFWQVLFFDTDWLVEKIKKTDVTLEMWDELKRGEHKSVREMAWACFYLNRTSFSGILDKNVGPLGGRTQTSTYKIDCRFPKDALIQRIIEAASYRERIYGIWNCSWKTGIERIRFEQKKGELPINDLFFYFDPPFFEKADALYRFYFLPEDHVALRDCLLDLEDKWILSYDAASEIEELYGDAIHHKKNGTHSQHVEIHYTLAKMSERKASQEVIISNMPVLPS
jgi:DNA adenine methylase